jgi:cytosine/adenosine deaminase-related metal-dependent hydrolase
MHVAESREELELLHSGTGPLVEFLQGLSAWTPGVCLDAPQNYLTELSQFRRALVIHGNYLNAEELAYLGERHDTMSLVYCPRTHAYFDHDPYPLKWALALGVNVAVGTDSRASNPDLNLLSELRFIADHYATVPLPTVLGLGTLNGARALGRDEEIGSLAPGKYANLAAIALPEDDWEPHELLFYGDGQAKAVWIRGQRV